MAHPWDLMKDSQNILEDYLKSDSSVDFEKMVMAYGDLVFGVAMRCTQSRVLSEEITQEVFITLARKASTIRETRKLPGWLHRTTVNCAANVNRKETTRRKAMKRYVDESQQLAFSSLEDEAEWKRALPILDQAINRLSTSDREVVLLRFHQKSSYRQISQLIGKSEEACRKKISRALEKLGASLKKEGVVATPSVLGMGMNFDLAGNHLPTAIHKITQLSITAKSTSSVPFLSLFTIMSKSKITVVSIAVLSLITGAGAYLSQHDKTTRLEKETAMLHEAITTETARQNSKNTHTALSEPHSPSPADSQAQRDWKTFGISLYQAERKQDYPAMVKLRGEISKIASSEALDVLDSLPELGLEPGPNEVLKRVLYGVAAKDYPQDVSNRFITEYREGKNEDFSMFSREFQYWAEKDSNAALQWLDKQIAEGIFESRALNGTHEDLAILEAQLLNGLLGSNPETLADRLKAMPDAQLLLTLTRASNHSLKPDMRKMMAELIPQIIPKHLQEMATKIISK